MCPPDEQAALGGRRSLGDVRGRGVHGKADAQAVQHAAGQQDAQAGRGGLRSRAQACARHRQVTAGQVCVQVPVGLLQSGLTGVPVLVLCARCEQSFATSYVLEQHLQQKKTWCELAAALPAWSPSSPAACWPDWPTHG